MNRGLKWLPGKINGLSSVVCGQAGLQTATYAVIKIKLKALATREMSATPPDPCRHSYIHPYGIKFRL